jgi:chorismate-pyruvate lyase
MVTTPLFNQLILTVCHRNQGKREIQEVRRLKMKGNYSLKIDDRRSVIIEEDSNMINVAREYIFHMRIVNTNKGALIG